MHLVESIGEVRSYVLACRALHPIPQLTQLENGIHAILKRTEDCTSSPLFALLGNQPEERSFASFFKELASQTSVLLLFFFFNQRDVHDCRILETRIIKHRQARYIRS